MSNGSQCIFCGIASGQVQSFKVYEDEEILAFLDINEEERIVDDKYATFANIAHSEINGTSLYYKISINWVYNKKGDEKAIKKLLYLISKI